MIGSLSRLAQGMVTTTTPSKSAALWSKSGWGDGQGRQGEWGVGMKGEWGVGMKGELGVGMKGEWGVARRGNESRVGMRRGELGLGKRGGEVKSGAEDEWRKVSWKEKGNGMGWW